MNPPKKPKLNPSSNAPSPGRANAMSTASPTACSTVIDVEALEQQWTPNREDRVANRQKKVRSAKCGPLRGGDWVLNQSGGGATLSFCFKHGDRTFGLTVGHLADLGSSIFCFAENDKVEHPLPSEEDMANAGKSYPMYEIGTVVSKSTTTDSLVFEIHVGPYDVEIAPFKFLAPSSGLGDQPIILPNPTDPTPRPQPGDLVVGLGAQRRGAIGKVASPSITRNGTFSRIGNISILHPRDSSKSLTGPGDCGTIFVGLDGTPFYFHHCAALHGDRFSYGFPVSQVMSAHAQLGGASEAQEEAQLALGDTEQDNQNQEVAGLQQFKTHIVPTPLAEETNALGHFDVQVVPTPRKNNNAKK